MIEKIYTSNVLFFVRHLNFNAYNNYMFNYDLIVIGGGHAGCEAVLSAAKLGLKTLLITLNIDNIALMPCNPAIGGPAKSCLVREIDAMGGAMGLAADATYMQMKMLNSSRGPAVRALRAQSDKKEYMAYMRHLIESQENISLKQTMAVELLVEDGKVKGIVDEFGLVYNAPGCCNIRRFPMIRRGPTRLPGPARAGLPGTPPF